MTDEMPIDDPQQAAAAVAEVPLPDSEPSAAEPPPAEEPAAAALPAPEAAPSRQGPGKTPPQTPAQAVAEPGPEPSPSNMRWYVVKVQSGREESIKEAIERRVKIEGLEEYFGRIIIPTEKVTEMRKGKREVRERKIFHGYLMVEVEYNDRILYLFRETSGVGDFVGGTVTRPPPPMSEQEVNRMLKRQDQLLPGIQPTKPQFDRGDRVKVKDGTFAGMEGEVKELIEAKGLVRVELTIFGRPVPVELEYWQVEHV